jgi:hypothetical protein
VETTINDREYNYKSKMLIHEKLDRRRAIKVDSIVTTDDNNLVRATLHSLILALLIVLGNCELHIIMLKI